MAEQLRSSLVHTLAFAGRITDAERLASSRYDESARANNALGVVASTLPLGQLDLWLGRPRTAQRRLGERWHGWVVTTSSATSPTRTRTLASARASIDPVADITADEPRSPLHRGTRARSSSRSRARRMRRPSSWAATSPGPSSRRRGRVDRALSGQRLLESSRFTAPVAPGRPNGSRRRSPSSVPEPRARSPLSSSSRPLPSRPTIPRNSSGRQHRLRAVADSARVRTLRARDPRIRGAAPQRPRGAAGAGARRGRTDGSAAAGRGRRRRATRRPTAREREVARLAAAGLTNGEIAAELTRRSARSTRTCRRRTGSSASTAATSSRRSFKGLSTPVPMTWPRGRDLIKPCRPSECPNCSSSCSSSC